MKYRKNLNYKEGENEKFLKVVGVILLSLIIMIGALAYYFRGQIGFI